MEAAYGMLDPQRVNTPVRNPKRLFRGTYHVDVLNIVDHAVVVRLELADQIVRLLFRQLLAAVGGQCFHDRINLYVTRRRIAFKNLWHEWGENARDNGGGIFRTVVVRLQSSGKSSWAGSSDCALASHHC